jgi:pimeloyl-ACP methyl ester carboxylesterase
MSAVRLVPRDRWPARDGSLTARTITLRSGMNLRVVEAGDPSAAPVLAVHGWGASAYHFRKNIPAIVETGSRVIAIDLPGHGGSDKPDDPERYTLSSLAGSIIEAMDALSLRRCAAVGQSMGAALLLRAAVADPERISRLATISGIGVVAPRVVPTFGRLIPAATAAVMPLLARRAVIRVVMRLAYGGPERPTSRDVDEVWSISEDPRYARALLHLVRRFEWTPLEEKELSALRMPLLVISGERDWIAPPARVRRRLGAMSDARLVIIRGGGHAVNEGNPAPVNRALTEFLSKSVA